MFRCDQRQESSFMNDFTQGFAGPPIGRKDLFALAALTLLFAVMLFATWQRWTQPLIDHGREMNLPARVLTGERLYVDVHFLYGPFAPYFNAFLYRLFGVHLSVLHASGAVSAALILLALYLLSRQLMDVWPSAAAVSLVMIICALKATANYIQPYAFAALYGLVFSLFSLTAVVFFLKAWANDRRHWFLFLAGLSAGMALISKWEIALASLAAAGVALAVTGVVQRRLPWRETLWFVAPALTVFLVVYALVLRQVSLYTLLIDNRVLFTNMPPQLVYFNGLVSGLGDLPRSLLFTLGGLGEFAVWVGVALTLGAAAGRGSLGRARVFKIGLALLLGGGLWREVAIRIFHISRSVSPLSSGAIVLPLTIAACSIMLWKGRTRTPFALQTLLVLSVFSLVSILRAIFNVKIASPYTPFFTPVLILVYLYLVMVAAPRWLVPHEPLRVYVHRAAIAFVAGMTISVGVESTLRLHRDNTFQVHAARGGFLTLPEIGAPLQQAIEYIEQNTRPEDYVLTLPQATTINFLSGRRTPFRDEIVHPGFLTGDQEDQAIRMIEDVKPPLIVIAALDTPEFRDRTFGVDYNLKLSEWIKLHYRLKAKFDPPAGTTPDLDGRPFYILIFANQ
jgi:hypothetical protein